MKFRGFDARTQATRWGLFAVAIGIVVGATGPTAIARARGRVGGEPVEPAVDLRADASRSWPMAPSRAR